MSNIKHIRPTVKLFFGTVVFFVLFSVISTTKASAIINLNPDPGGGIPADLRDSLRGCDTSGRSPAILYWVSSPGNPNQREVSVPYGAAFIDLDVNVAAAVCYTNSAVYETNTRIVGSNAPSITSGLNSQLYVNYTAFMGPGNFNVPGTYRQTSTRIRFAPPGGFTESRVYDLGVVAKSVNNFRNTSFLCVNNTGGNFPAANINDFSRCPNIPLPSAVSVNVLGLEGDLNVVDCDAISGWAFDRDNPSASVDIHVYRLATDGRNIGPTNVFRGDVNSFFGISGNHGYFWSIPPEWKDGQTAAIAVYAINLPGTPGANRLIGFRAYPSNCNQNWDLDVDVTCDVQNGVLGFTITKTGTVPGNVTVTRNASLTNPAQNIPIPALTLTNASFSGNTWSQTVPFSAVLGQSVNATISVSPGGGTNGNPSNDSATCNDGPKVAKPYFRSYGGDVVVGRNFVNNGSCSATQPSSSIKAFTRQNGTDFAGSGSEFAARATDVIEGFLSASTRTSNPVSPNGLSFGNRTGVGNDQSAYTGCIPDYWNEYIQGKYPDQATLDSHNLNKSNKLGLTANGSGEWGDPINGITIGADRSGYYFYDGDLTITGNVTLAGYSYNASDSSANLNQIPKFVLIVRGNINIAPNVTQLQGVFIAQEDSGKPGGGIINTCAGPGVNWQQCFAGPKLEVQGSFIAREVKLNRLRGDIEGAGVREGSDAPQAAEVFIFRPDLLLSTAGDEQNPSTKITDYDSIVGLPPVL